MVIDAINNAPSVLIQEIPNAIINSFNPTDLSMTPKTVFSKGEAIGFQVTIQVNGETYTPFSGSWVVPIWKFNEYNKTFDTDVAIVQVIFTAGVSNVVTIGPFNKSMIIGINKQTSNLVVVPTYTVTITE